MRMQQILAHETDLLEFEDLFDGNPAIDAKTDALIAAARSELDQIEAMGGAMAAVGHMKSRLVESNAARIARIESGETIVVGVNKWTESEESPLTTGPNTILEVDPAAERDQITALANWKADRDDDAVATALDALRSAAASGENIMPTSIAAAKAGVTTGEWGEAMRSAFGLYRAPTGISATPSNQTEGLDQLRSRVDVISDRLGRRLRLLVGKPGLDGHSNGAEQIALRAQACGIEIDYQGIRLTPDEIVTSAREGGAHVIGLSILSGSHMPLVKETINQLAANGLGEIPIVVGGIIPPEDAQKLKDMGVAQVYSPRDFEISNIIAEILDIVDSRPVAAE